VQLRMTCPLPCACTITDKAFWAGFSEFYGPAKPYFDCFFQLKRFAGKSIPSLECTLQFRAFDQHRQGRFGSILVTFFVHAKPCFDCCLLFQ
jgi:hypothetical protein